MGAMGVTPESHRAHGALLPRAARADAVHFQRLRLRPEAQRLRARFKLRDHVEVLEFGRTVAAIADQERHRVLRRARVVAGNERSEEHTSELQSLMRISYAVFCLTKKKKKNKS